MVSNSMLQTSDGNRSNRVRSLREAAEVLGISVATLRRRIADGTGPHLLRLSIPRVGILERNLDAWVDRCGQDVAP